MIKTLYDLKPETIYRLGEFSILWGEFEYWICREISHGIKGNKVNKLEVYQSISDKLTPDERLNMLHNRIRNSLSDYIESTDKNTIKKMLYNQDWEKDKDKDDPMVMAMKEFLENKGEATSYVGCMSCIYRIRNNMFHGTKSLLKLDEQTDIFAAINSFLEYFVDNRIRFLFDVQESKSIDQ